MFRRLEADEHIGGKEKGMNGNHRPVGIFMLSRPFTVEAMSLLDVAPTVYDVLGVAAPEMDGHSVLGGAVEESAHHPEKTVTNEAYTVAQEAAVEARLRDLGYFE